MSAAFVAKDPHGMWSSVSTLTCVNAIIFKLQDTTSDHGPLGLKGLDRAALLLRFVFQ